jgi:hypothetical protein
MAFDFTTRGKLQRLVTACRNLLTDEFDDQLQRIYGVYAEEGRVLELDKLTSLDDDQRATGSLLRERIAHLQSGLAGSKTPLKDSVQRVLREQAFTVLNRFAALRMAEERELVLQCVGDGLNSKGFQVFESVASPDLGSQYERYCVFLGCLFDELSLDLGVLFDRYSPFGLLFPREPKLKEFLLLLNDPELKSLWREDETIGWIYQYFNDPAERKQMREAAAPRDSRELAVRNQFFTPRYVVEFLIDNTLGRLWYEMTKGRTELARHCRYLVRRPNEVFLGNPNVISSLDAAAPWVREVILTGDFSRLPEDPTVGELSDLGLAINGYAEMERRGRSWDDFIASFYDPQAEAAEKTGQPWKGDAFDLWCALFAYQREVLRNGEFSDTDRTSGDGTLRHLWPVLRHALQNPPADLSKEEMLRQPQFIPHRPIKDPREIRLLDPACGSMHFGLYASDLFETIYAEAHQAHVEVGTQALRDGAGRGVLDAVSADAAAFSREVPRLIVECNVHGIDIDARAVQIAGLSLWLRAQRAWHQAGVKSADRPRITRSNLVCAEPMPGEKKLLGEFVEQQFPAGERPAFAFLLEKIFDHMTFAGEAGSLLRIEEEIRTAIGEAKRVWREGPRHEQAALFPETTAKPGQGEMRLDLSGITDEQFWARAEQRIYDALEAYAERAENDGGFQRRLFADDAAQGFAFIDLCRKRYDVAVMNPPFGLAPRRIFEHLKAAYQDTYVDLYGCFVVRGVEFSPMGLVGAITSRAFLMTKKLARWRENQLVPSVNLILDLGIGVMDNAFVEAAAYTLQSSGSTGPIVAVNRRHVPVKDQPVRFDRAEEIFVVPRSEIRSLPAQKLLYQLPFAVFSLLREKPTFEPTIGTARDGMRTFDDFRFLRLRWEVPSDSIGESKLWEPLAKGGEHAKYYSDLHLLVKWNRDGKELAEVNIQVNGQVAQSRQASDYYRRRGATYSKRSVKGFSVRALPLGCIIGTKGPAVLSESEVEPAYLVGWLNSTLVVGLIHIQANAYEFNTGIIKNFPWRYPRNAAELAALTTRTILKVREFKVSEETNSLFSIPIAQAHSSRAAQMEKLQKEALRAVQDCEASWDAAMGQLYGIDRLNIDEAPDEPDDPTDEDSEDEDEGFNDWRIGSARTLVSQLLGHAFGRWDIRYATGERPARELPDPFAPLPVCHPGCSKATTACRFRPKPAAGFGPTAVTRSMWLGTAFSWTTRSTRSTSKLASTLALPSFWGTAPTRWNTKLARCSACRLCATGFADPPAFSTTI